MEKHQDPQERFVLFKTYLENPSLLSKAQTLLIHKRLRCKQRGWLGSIETAKKIMSLPIFDEGRITVQSSWGWERSVEIHDLEIFIKSLAEVIVHKTNSPLTAKTFPAFWTDFLKEKIQKLSNNLEKTFQEYSQVLKGCKLARPDRLDKLGRKLQLLIKEVLEKLPTQNIRHTASPIWPYIQRNNLIDDILNIFQKHCPDLNGDRLFTVVEEIANAFLEPKTTYDAIRGRYNRLVSG